jgi:hypothetical protein
MISGVDSDRYIHKNIAIVKNGGTGSMSVIRGKSLSTYEVALDGRTVSIHVEDENARPGSLVLPSDCLGPLMVTLSEMLRQSMSRRYQDPSLRYVYPVADWELEASGERPDLVILTLRTPDGFHMSFGIERSDLRYMVERGLSAAPEMRRH